MTASQVVVEIVKEKIVSRKSALFVEVLIILNFFSKRIKKKKEKARAAGDLDNRHMERTPRKCFRCRSEDHLIAKFPKPPKENYKQKKASTF